MKIFATTTFVALLAAGTAAAIAAERAADCAQAQGSVLKLICQDAALAALDRQLDDAYGEALARATGEAVEGLPAEQRDWVKRRDECARDRDVRTCVEGRYKDRIALLQAAWQLVPVASRATFTCAGAPGGAVVATYYATDPPAVRLERGSESVLAFQHAAPGGARYEGPKVTFENRGDDASLAWNGATQACRIKR